MISYSKPTELGGTAGRTRDQLCPARSPEQAQKVSKQQGNHLGQDERLFVGSSFGAAATAAVGRAARVVLLVCCLRVGRSLILRQAPAGGHRTNRPPRPAKQRRCSPAPSVAVTA